MWDIDVLFIHLAVIYLSAVVIDVSVKTCLGLGWQMHRNL